MNGSLRSSFMRSSQADGEVSLNKVWVDGEVKCTSLCHLSLTFQQVFEFIDVDGDGRMSFAVARMQGMDRDAFSKLDKDRDGFVTLADFEAYVNRR